MNLGTFTGRVGRDAEVRNATNGDRVANFPLAVDVGTKASQKTMWLDCSIWGKRADSLSAYLVKGLKLTASGRVNMDEFKKNDGTNGYRLQLTINDLDLHGSSHNDNAQGKPADAKPGLTDDDVPF
jgi:single-strand DNA-binding protein